MLIVASWSFVSVTSYFKEIGALNNFLTTKKIENKEKMLASIVANLPEPLCIISNDEVIFKNALFEEK